MSFSVTSISRPIWSTRWLFLDICSSSLVNNHGMALIIHHLIRNCYTQTTMNTKGHAMTSVSVNRISEIWLNEFMVKLQIWYLCLPLIETCCVCPILFMKLRLRNPSYLSPNSWNVVLIQCYLYAHNFFIWNPLLLTDASSYLEVSKYNSLKWRLSQFASIICTSILEHNVKIRTSGRFMNGIVG